MFSALKQGKSIPAEYNKRWLNKENCLWTELPTIIVKICRTLSCLQKVFGVWHIIQSTGRIFVMREEKKHSKLRKGCIHEGTEVCWKHVLQTEKNPVCLGLGIQPWKQVENIPWNWMSRYNTDQAGIWKLLP